MYASMINLLFYSIIKLSITIICNSSMCPKYSHILCMYIPWVKDIFLKHIICKK